MYTTCKWLARGLILAIIFIAPALQSNALDIPETIRMESLSSLYEAVTFDHALHLDLANNCADCHHHGTGAPVLNENCARCHSDSKRVEVVGCAECHPLDPFSAEYLYQTDKNVNLYHRDKPGLKAAYHQNCLGCHEEMGGPVGCQDCHLRTDAGDAYFKAGSYAPAAKPGKGH